MPNVSTHLASATITTDGDNVTVELFHPSGQPPVIHITWPIHMTAAQSAAVSQVVTGVADVLRLAVSRFDETLSSIRVNKCPASRKWQDFGSFKGGDCRVGDAEMYLQRPVPGQRLVWSDRVELDPELLRVSGQVKHVDDVLAVEPLVLQRLERSLPHAVLSWRVDPGANVPQLGMGGDERGESKRPERAAVVGHQDHRGDLTGLCIGDSFKQRPAEKTRSFGDGLTPRRRPRRAG
jgi:hypothetical protein